LLSGLVSCSAAICPRRRGCDRSRNGSGASDAPGHDAIPTKTLYI
jgi:hypothetical protein